MPCLPCSNTNILENDFKKLIDARGDISVGVCNPGLSLLGLLVAEMWGDELVPSVICGIFEFVWVV